MEQRKRRPLPTRLAPSDAFRRGQFLQRCLCCLLILLWIAAAIPAGRTCASADELQPFEALRGETMGTTYTVRFAGLPADVSPEQLQIEIDSRLERVNDQMSTWRPDSELSRFNRHAGGDWFAVSAETFAVVAEAQRISRQSGGAFDATVMPLVDLWSFGPAGRPRQTPGEVELAAVRRLVGYDLVETRADPPALRKVRAGVQLDLSAIAKGFGVDLLAAYLDEIGVAGWLVEIGGEVRARGRKADGARWKVGIERPVAGQRGLQHVIELDDLSLATSGDYRNYFEQDGRRYSHTIDPRTGRPIEHSLVSVSVFAENCTTADGLATALMVLGPDEAYNLAEREQIAALLIVGDGERFVERATPQFIRLFGPPAGDAAPESASNMTTWLLTIAVFLTAVALMAVGVIFGRRRLRGSCGGLAGLRDEQGHVLCDACTSPSESCTGPPDDGRQPHSTGSDSLQPGAPRTAERARG